MATAIQTIGENKGDKLDKAACNGLEERESAGETGALIFFCAFALVPTVETAGISTELELLNVFEPVKARKFKMTNIKPVKIFKQPIIKPYKRQLTKHKTKTKTKRSKGIP